MWSSLQKIKRLDLIYRAPSNPLSWSLYEIKGHKLPAYVFIPEPPANNPMSYWRYIRDNLQKIKNVLHGNQLDDVKNYTQKIGEYIEGSGSDDQVFKVLMEGVRINGDDSNVVATALDPPYTQEFFAEPEDPPIVKKIKEALNNRNVTYTVEAKQSDPFSKPEFLKDDEEVHAQYHFTIPSDE